MAGRLGGVDTARLSSDFKRFWAGQTISQMGSSFTLFATPLLVYKLTHSAVNLGIATATTFVPYLLFGLVIGAWVDRVNRKRMMILVDLGRAATIAVIPLLSALGSLSVWHVYAVGFVSSVLTIFFEAGEFAAIPSLVPTDDLVDANGKIQASYSAAQVLGPLLAGLLLALVAVQDLFLIDAASFLVSAAALALVGRSFNGSLREGRTSIREDVREGLRYVIRHPVLRNISIMMALFNFIGVSTSTQLVFFAKGRLAATDTEVGLLYSAGSLGVVALGLLAGRVRRRLRFGPAALGSLALVGLLTVAFAYNRWYWLALLVWALLSGIGIFFNINTGSLRQAIVPNALLGRIVSIAGVLAWGAIPLGGLLGGFAIRWSGSVVAVYVAMGVLETLIAAWFYFRSPLGHAEEYLPGGRLAAQTPSTNRCPFPHCSEQSSVEGDGCPADRAVVGPFLGERPTDGVDDWRERDPGKGPGGLDPAVGRAGAGDSLGFGGHDLSLVSGRWGSIGSGGGQRRGRRRPMRRRSARRPQPGRSRGCGGCRR
jgi:MFS family permease